MRTRLVSIAALVVVLLAWLSPLPAGAQTTDSSTTTTAPAGTGSPLQPAVDGLAAGLANLDPLLTQLEPLTGQLDPAVAGLIAGIEPLIAGLEEILAQAAPLCAALGPVLTGLEPLTSELQTLLDLDVSNVPVVGAVQPVLDTVNRLVDDVLGLCAAEVTTTTTTAPALAPAPAELPRTGGPGDLAVPAVGALGLGGLLAAARRRAALAAARSQR